MIRLLFISLLISAGFQAQVNFDSLQKVSQSESNQRKKIDLFLRATENTKLSISDYEQLDKIISSISKEVKLDSYGLGVMSGIYSIHNNFDKATEYAEQALKKAEKEKDTITLGYANIRIATCFNEQRNYDKALEYFRNAASWYRLMKTEHPYNRLRDVYNNMGSVFKDSKKLDSALYYHQKTLELAIRVKDRKQQAYSYNNIGLVYNRMNKPEKALEFYEMSALIKKEMKDYNSLCGTIINKASVLKKMGRNNDALDNYAEGIKMAFDYKRGNFLMIGVKDLADFDLELKDYKSAALNYARYFHLSDSINKDREAKKLEELTARYESEKKDAEILKSREDIKNKETIIKKQKQFNYAIGAVLALAMISILVVYRSYRQNKRFSKNLAEQKNLIEEKNKEITDSINYAKRIQESLLTSNLLFSNNTSDHFILFKPKDIVSGDFYWAHESAEGFMVMCGDCTGHGVPGAFMSLLGISYLNEIVQQKGTHQPSKVFDELKKKVISSLNQKDEARKDGMDASLIKIKNNRLEFACSHNPIWIIRNGRVLKYKADKSPIGMGVQDDFVFSHQTEILEKGDCIYLFSDGYADQFGGPNGKKFKVKQLEEKMIEIAPLSMRDQREKLEIHFNEWKGDLDQVDDVCIIGIKI